jgi:predicted RND superfamily exporter protein
MVLVMLPPILVTVGSAYGLQIVNRRQREYRSSGNPRAAAAVAVTRSGLPVALATATTAVGFAANTVMRIPAIRWFGLFSAVGVLFAFVLAVALVPALLAVTARRHRPVEKVIRTGRSHPGRSFWRAWTGVVYRGRRIVLVLAVLMAVGAAVFIPRVRPETDFVRYLKSGSAPTVAAQVIDDRFGGYQQFEVLVDGDMQDPLLLARLDEFQQALSSVPHVTRTFSLVDILRAANQAFNGGAQEYDRLPDTRSAIAQHLLVLSFSGSDFLGDYVTSDYRLGRITARFDANESRAAGVAVDSIKTLISRYFDGDAQVRLGGMPMAVHALDRDIRTSQLLTLIIALIAVFVLVAAVFRSVRLGLLALVPVVLAVVVSFGFMGFMGLQVDIVTALIGAIAVGIGIDYSCHLVARWREEQGVSPRERMSRVMEGTGPPIAVNMLSVGIGFAVLILASLPIIAKFGALIAGMTVLAGFGALVVIPALFSLSVEKRRK